MKHLKLFAFVALMFFISQAVNAQAKQKFGHVDSQELLKIMPEREAAQKALQKEATDMESELQTMQAEFESKYKTYLSKKDSLSPMIKETKETELQDMQTRIESFRGTAQQTLQKREGELLQPIIDKIQKAIKDVGEENSFLYIYDVSVLLFYSKESQDIMPLVKKKLALK